MEPFGVGSLSGPEPKAIYATLWGFAACLEERVSVHRDRCERSTHLHFASQHWFCFFFASSHVKESA